LATGELSLIINCDSGRQMQRVCVWTHPERLSGYIAVDGWIARKRWSSF